MSKRLDNEKKSITKSLKISSDELSIIEEKAKDKNMNFSKFMIDCAVHNQNTLNPQIMCRLENIIEKCTKVAVEKDDMDFIRLEADKLWEFLK